MSSITQWIRWNLSTLLPIVLAGLVLSGLIAVIVTQAGDNERKWSERKSDAGVTTLSEYPYPIHKLPLEEGYIVMSSNGRGSWAVFVPNPPAKILEEN